IERARSVHWRLSAWLLGRLRRWPRDSRRFVGAQHNATPEAHPANRDGFQARGTPVTLELRQRMDGVEALDAGSEKIADRPPRRRQYTAHERQTDARVHAPQEAPEGAPRHTELEHGQSSAWAEYAGELANGGPWIV